MKKDPLLFSIFVTVAWLGIIQLPVQYLFPAIGVTTYLRELKTLVIAGLIFFLALQIARKKGILEAGGFTAHTRGNYWMAVLPFLFPGLLAIGSAQAGCFILNTGLVLSIATLVVRATLEEVVFRGLIQGYLLKTLKQGSHHLIAFTTTILFSIGHMTNAFYLNFPSVMNQVIYAFFMGLFFSALNFRMKNVWILGAIHGGMNFLFSICSYAGIQPTSEEVPSFNETLINFGNLVLLFSPVLLIYWLLMRPLKTQKINLERTNNPVREI